MLPIVLPDAPEEHRISEHGAKHMERPGAFLVTVRVEQPDEIRLKRVDHRTAECNVRLNDLASQLLHASPEGSDTLTLLHPKLLEVRCKTF